MRRMPPIARLAAVSLDSADPAALAGFYRELLGLETFFETEDFVVLKGGGILVTTQRDLWRVLLDPDGHPFCITTLIPDA